MYLVLFVCTYFYKIKKLQERLLALSYDAAQTELTVRPHNKDSDLQNKHVTCRHFSKNLLMRTLPEVSRHVVVVEVERKPQN